MAFFRTTAVVALCLAPHVEAAGTSASMAMTRANPIRRVVNMLQGMTKKIEQEGEKEEEMFNKFFCYCKNGKGQLEKEIADAETKIPQLEASIKETEGSQEQLGSGVGQAKKDREEAKEAVAEATALREKEAASYASASAEATANIDAMGKAIGALGAGSASSFLQTSDAGILKKVLVNADLSSSDRDTVASFLSTGESDEEDSAGSGEIVGILKQLKETMEGDLAEATATEDESIKSFDSLVASKNKEIEALTTTIEQKITRDGEGGVALTEMKEDLDDTSKALAENKKLSGDLEANCKTKKAEWEERQKMRGEELLALADTIKLLNSDEALELFKKTLPSASLLQVAESSKELRNQAAAVLAKKGHRDARVDLISLALKGKKVSFDKVIAMVDEMIGVLGAEQKDDDAKKTYCEGEIDKTEDEIKELKLKGSDLVKADAEAKGSIATLTDEIAALEQGIKDLDAQVAEATENRKEENSEYKSVTAGNVAAIELLGMAKNRLNKFYNPKLAKFVQVQEAQPETPSGPYKKSGEESNGVIAMIDTLAQDLEKENTQMEVEEKNAQEEYESAMKDSTEKRSTDLKSIEEKEGAKADAEASLDKIKADTKATLEQEMATAEILGALHKECDWLMSNYDVRKEARSSEVEALNKAKAVLSGADYSFLQTKSSHATIRSLRGA